MASKVTVEFIIEGYGLNIDKLHPDVFTDQLADLINSMDYTFCIQDEYIKYDIERYPGGILLKRKKDEQ